MRPSLIVNHVLSSASASYPDTAPLNGALCSGTASLLAARDDKLVMGQQVRSGQVGLRVVVMEMRFRCSRKDPTDAVVSVEISI